MAAILTLPNGSHLKRSELAMLKPILDLDTKAVKKGLQEMKGEPWLEGVFVRLVRDYGKSMRIAREMEQNRNMSSAEAIAETIKALELARNNTDSAERILVYERQIRELGKLADQYSHLRSTEPQDREYETIKKLLEDTIRGLFFRNPNHKELVDNARRAFEERLGSVVALHRQ